MDCGDGLIELINPRIVERSGEQTGAEACLSFPGFYGHVLRSTYMLKSKV
nr:peptide deformylase [Cohnella faecalis]